MASAHFNWIQLVPGVTHDNIHVATAMATGGLLIATSAVARMALGQGETAIAPAKNFSLKGFFEMVIEFIAGLIKIIIGDKGLSFTPLFATLFFFIFTSNLVGLIPGMTPATENLNTTIGLGLFSFVAYNIYGLKEHGLAYIKQFMGPLWALAIVVFPIELISHALRPMSLGLRLMGNMTGDHIVLSIFNEILPVELRFIPVATVFYALGIFVCFMQAFVFTLLSMVYVSLAISHDH